MTYYQFMLNRYQNFSLQVKYIVGYILLLCPVIMAIAFVRNEMPFVFHLVCYFIGWLTWTFVEYILHRFWQHGEHSNRDHNSIKLHQNHHAHPNEIKITTGHRLLLAIFCIVMFGLSVLFNNFFSILTGVVFGFTGYTFMHWLLHRRWTAIVFPRLHRFHIYHHCKYPNHCHGISVPWWDILFNTIPPMNKEITEKVKSFFYGK